MERIHVLGNTWCLNGRQLIPYYQVDEHTCILLDGGRVSEREAIAAALEETGLRPVGIILTHMHFDHNENTKWLKERYGIPAAMSRGEADICRSAVTLKNHLFNFTPGVIASTQRLQDIICPIEYPLDADMGTFVFQGVPFEIIPTPGHAPDHIAVATPDGVCYLGDALLCGDSLTEQTTPFVFGLELDLETKKRLLTLDYPRYIFAHKGILEREEYPAVAQANIDQLLRRTEMIRVLVTEPMTFCRCYECINQTLGQDKVHPVWNLQMERYLRPYLEYLVDSGQLKLVLGGGAPTVAPRDWADE